MQLRDPKPKGLLVCKWVLQEPLQDNVLNVIFPLKYLRHHSSTLPVLLSLSQLQNIVYFNRAMIQRAILKTLK